MRLWRFSNPFDKRNALASRVGTWVQVGDPPYSVRVKPLVVEWEPSSTLVGDLTLASPEGLMARREVAEELLAAGFKGFEMGPVEMVPNRDHKRHRRNMIQLPYDGPELVELYPTQTVPLNRSLSTFEVVGERGGEPVIGLSGEEHIEHGKLDLAAGTMERIQVPRTPGMGAYVNAQQLNGCDFFRIAELSGWVVCTDRVRDFILERKYSNIAFFEIGEIVESTTT